MIIDFSVGNFRSVKEVQSINMTAANIVSKFKELDLQNVIKVNEKWTFLKSKAIYGANASGKSNLIRALVSFISLVDGSVKDDKLLNNQIDPFRLSSEYDDKPSFFQLMFLVDDVFYRYGFEATSKEIVSEWLFGTPGKKEVVFFTRERNQIEINEKKFSEGSKLKELVRENALFLTVVNSLNGEVSRKLATYISEIMVVSGLGDNRLYKIASEALDDELMKRKILGMLKVADVGIEDIWRLDINHDEDAISKGQDSENKNKRSFLMSTHKRMDVKKNEKTEIPFSFDLQESGGSKKMFEISPVILNALENNRPLIIDEFDARFHPLLTKKLVELFNSDLNKKTQFLFVTHDTNLLNAEILRRDQVSFVEKDRDDATHIYSLVEFKGVRNDSSFEKDYIKGKYGAIPFLGNFEIIFEDHA
jgi:AAA15 family ATPase/GTPase